MSPLAVAVYGLAAADALAGVVYGLPACPLALTVVYGLPACPLAADAVTPAKGKVEGLGGEDGKEAVDAFCDA